MKKSNIQKPNLTMERVNQLLKAESELANLRKAYQEVNERAGMINTRLTNEIVSLSDQLRRSQEVRAQFHDQRLASEKVMNQFALAGTRDAETIAILTRLLEKEVSISEAILEKLNEQAEAH